MVESVVSFVVKRLGDYLIQEVAFLQEVRNEVESVKKDLEWMLCFIKDAEDKQIQNNMIRQWISDVKEIAYDTEDVLDEYMLKAHNEETSNMLMIDKGGTLKRRQGILKFINMCSWIRDPESIIFRKGKEKVNLYGIGKEIERLKKKLNDISHRRQLFGLENINIMREEESQSLSKSRQLRRTTSFEHSKINVVGYEDFTHNLLAKLLSMEARRSVVSIFGIGGLGKTTLARKLYHNRDVMNKFGRYRAWVSVSQDYKTHDLLLRIIKSFDIVVERGLEKMNEEDLERILHRSLEECCYLLVIDDVWDREAWKSLKRSLPDNRNGSRVIITTRNKDVAEHSDENTYTHALRFLCEDESWQLFCEKAFENSIVDEGLEMLGREMVQKCGGLPLAIVVLGGLLYKKNLHVWHHVYNQIWQDLRKDIQISYLFDLSFNDLPYQMKVCFLYLSHFPEDSVIMTEKLIRLWVAEGFIPQNEKVMEEVANDYLNELIDRSLIQIDQIRRGRIVTCKVHDLLRDLAIQKAKEMNFIDIYDELKHSTLSPTLCRRQVVYSGEEKNLWIQQCNPLFRSLLFFDSYGKNKNLSTITEDLPTIFTRFRLVRILDLENCYIGQFRSLPEEIGKLIHLKYLGLRNTGVKYLPTTILNLLSLQTLDLYHANSYPQLPMEIYKLKELRHLIGKFEGHLKIDNMTKLQTLNNVRCDTWTGINPEKLVNLRELRISKYQAVQKEFNFDSIAKLKSLQILWVELSSEDYYFASLQPLFHCQYLVDLTLEGKVEELPENLHALLPNLEFLTLWNSYLVNDPMPTLEKLQRLMILDLRFNSYCGNKMICSEKGFPQLETLYLDVRNLEEWQVEERAMPMLRGLKIEGKNSELRIPARLRSIPVPNDY